MVSEDGGVFNILFFSGVRFYQTLVHKIKDMLFFFQFPAFASDTCQTQSPWAKCDLPLHFVAYKSFQDVLLLS